MHTAPFRSLAVAQKKHYDGIWSNVAWSAAVHTEPIVNGDNGIWSIKAVE